MSARLSAITDWHTPEDALPDVLPGDMYEHGITPQKRITLCRVLVRDLHLAHLRIGNVEISFKLENADGPLRTYQPTLRRTDLVTELQVLAGQDVRVTLRNDGALPVKPRAALLVREEESN